MSRLIGLVFALVVWRMVRARGRMRTYAIRDIEARRLASRVRVGRRFHS